MTLVFKNSEKAFDDNLTEQYKKILYPDPDKLKKDEQHRFELLLAHWDVMIEKVAVEEFFKQMVMDVTVFLSKLISPFFFCY